MSCTNCISHPVTLYPYLRGSEYPFGLSYCEWLQGEETIETASISIQRYPPEGVDDPITVTATIDDAETGVNVGVSVPADAAVGDYHCNVVVETSNENTIVSPLTIRIEPN